jgi:hypothetical protein
MFRILWMWRYITFFKTARQINLVHNITPCFFKIHINVILPAVIFQNGQDFLPKFCMHLSPPHAFSIPCQFIASIFVHPDNQFLFQMGDNFSTNSDPAICYNSGYSYNVTSFDFYGKIYKSFF